jgi:hypothetical protein
MFNGRITSSRIFIKLRLKTGSSASRIEGSEKRSLRRPTPSAIKGSSAPEEEE